MLILRAFIFWGVLLAVFCAVLATVLRWFPAGVGAGAEALQPILYWTTFANTALGGATVLYFVHGMSRMELVGRAASALAMFGVAGGVLAFAAHWHSVGAIAAPGATAVGLFELTAGCSIVVVTAYLVAETLYGNRSTSLLIMPAVMLAIACEIWLASQGAMTAWSGPVVLAGYWDAAYRMATVLGYAALAASAVAGAALWRSASKRFSGMRPAVAGLIGGSARVARGNLIGAVVVGVALLSFAGIPGLFLAFDYRAVGEAMIERQLPLVAAYSLLCALGTTRAVGDRWIAAATLAVFVLATVQLAPPPSNGTRAGLSLAALR